MAMYGMDSKKMKSGNQQMVMPFESLLLRKLAFSKLVDATAKKSLMARQFRNQIIEKIVQCYES
jgi:hypothetical protein